MLNLYRGSVIKILARKLGNQIFITSPNTNTIFAISFESEDAYSIHLTQGDSSVTLVACGYVFNSGPWLDDLEDTIKDYLLEVLKNEALEHLNSKGINFSDVELSSDTIHLYEGKTITNQITFVNDTLIL